MRQRIINSGNDSDSAGNSTISDQRDDIHRDESVAAGMRACIRSDRSAWRVRCNAGSTPGLQTAIDRGEQLLPFLKSVAAAIIPA